MRFVHKKIPKSLAFSHILSAWLRRELEFDLPDRHLVRRLRVIWRLQQTRKFTALLA